MHGTSLEVNGMSDIGNTKQFADWLNVTWQLRKLSLPRNEAGFGKLHFRNAATCPPPFSTLLQFEFDRKLYHPFDLIKRSAAIDNTHRLSKRAIRQHGSSERAVGDAQGVSEGWQGIHYKM